MLALQAGGTALLWGVVTGQLLLAVCPVPPPEAAQSQTPPTVPPRQGHALMSGSVGLAFLVMAAVMVLPIRIWLSPPPQVVEGATFELSEVLRDAGWQPVPCSALRPVPNSAGLCFGVWADGPSAAQRLTSTLKAVYGTPEATRLQRQGNLLTAQVRLQVPLNLWRAVPVDLTAQGLIFVNQRQPLSATERWLAGQATPTFLQVRRP
ncbi:hypothetical protein [Deinococcus aquaedulcis]|uniref:hypothetical protein n=1 Tax=Deinococcus aquaedulcis TaxID=2840455 RepID=UPI001C840284|nr:hypothetical protein [Deinococcus aquaedulcis]